VYRGSPNLGALSSFISALLKVEQYLVAIFYNFILGTVDPASGNMPALNEQLCKMEVSYHQ